MVAETLAQQAARSPEPGHYGADGQLCPLGDLLIGQTVEQEERDDEAKLGGQTQNRCLRRLCELPALDLRGRPGRASAASATGSPRPSSSLCMAKLTVGDR